jgi:flagellar biosynthesis/type III secretory pathway M-ring protein FliF/YscJ
MDYGWFVFIGFIIIMAIIVLVVRRRNFTKVEKFTPTNSRRNAISKKDAEYAHSMYKLEDEQDDLEAIDFGEAYNFHSDCGDR